MKDDRIGWVRDKLLPVQLPHSLMTRNKIWILNDSLEETKTPSFPSNVRGWRTFHFPTSSTNGQRPNSQHYEFTGQIRTPNTRKKVFRSLHENRARNSKQIATGHHYTPRKSQYLQMLALNLWPKLFSLVFTEFTTKFLIVVRQNGLWEYTKDLR